MEKLIKIVRTNATVCNPSFADYIDAVKIRNIIWNSISGIAGHQDLSGEFSASKAWKNEL